MSALAPRLIHRVTLQNRVYAKDSDGNDELTWVDFVTNEPAEVAFLSGREFIAARSNQSQVVARATINWRSGITPSMRLIFDGQLYNIEAVLPDPSARRWLTLMLNGGVSDGQ